MNGSPGLPGLVDLFLLVEFEGFLRKFHYRVSVLPQGTYPPGP